MTLQSSTNLTGKTVLVTGASPGIAWATIVFACLQPHVRIPQMTVRHMG
ncbi:MAG TPA: hypothetical protein VK608_05550 [Edaphobacter sp.]|nr:hypothetical protein [Edaphobacter sp.]